MNLKQAAGEKAAEFVRSGMTIGLGTGSTVYWTIRKIGAMIAEDDFAIRAVPTSRATATLASELKIPLVGFGEVVELDLTIDGADEISPRLDLIKGGGGALLREKLVAAASKRLIIVADENKSVEKLGAFRVPVEIVPFAWETTARRIEAAGGLPILRRSENQIFTTDNGNYIVDCDCGLINEPDELHRTLKLLPGVIETGLFVGMAETAIIAGADGVKVLSKSSQ